jgi:hypothetical protein
MGILKRKRQHMDSPFDVSKLQDDVEEQMRALPLIPFSPPPPVPVSAEELGRITADAVKAAHESAVKALEDLCSDIAQRVSAIEQLKADSLNQIEECKELANQYRESGNMMAAKVEHATAELKEARELIESIRKKIGN